MSKNSLIRKGLAFVVIILLISITFASGINANNDTSTPSNEDKHSQKSTIETHYESRYGNIPIRYRYITEDGLIRTVTKTRPDFMAERIQSSEEDLAIISANVEMGNHPPIKIDGNDDFTSENGVTSGSGTKEDPYIIEDWVIVGDGLDGDGIFVNNTDAFFVIRNCTISGFNDDTGPSWGAGIRLSTVENGRIESTTTYGNYYGIMVQDDSAHIEINNCSCYNYSVYMTTGIYCYSSSNITISFCVCFNKDYGIQLTDTSHVLIEKSKFYNNSNDGISLMGKHFKYVKIKECEIYLNEFYGIWAEGLIEYSHSTYIHIANCEIYDNGLPKPGYDNGFDGIHIACYHDNIIENCTIYNNYQGIRIGGSMNNIIRNCSIYNHSHNTFFLASGVYLGFLGLFPLGEIRNANKLFNCDIYNNDIGVLIDITKAKIYKNNVFNNGYIGIAIGPLSRAKVTYNNIYDNGYEFDNLTDVMVEKFSLANLRHNCWGSPDGPSGVGPGSGDSIYRKFSIAIFRPWATEPIPDAGVQQ